MPDRLLAMLVICGMALRAQTLPVRHSAILQAIDAHAPASIALLEKIVNINSGTFHKAGVIAVGKLLEPEFQAVGFQTRWISMDSVNRAPHLVAERKGARGKRLLLIGHLDTVFEPSSPFQSFQRAGDTATGPGVSDMKGGIVIILSALTALHKVGALQDTSITVFLTGDEESAGKPTEISRKELVEAGKNSDAALCFEGGVRMDGKDYASTARRGAITWELRVKSGTGHSSGIFGERLGSGSVFELARILNAFHETLREPNVTYSVGLLAGGATVNVSESGEASVTGKPNIVPGEAVAVGDLRTLTPQQFGRVKDKMHSILARNLRGATATLEFREGYPPMAPTPGNAALLGHLNAANRALGLPEMGALDPMLRGAGDISFVAEYVDSLSGLGAYGNKAHAPGESVDLARLPLQSKRAALLIERLINEPRR
ncbi:MAG TPA: M20/M25/M40 family metallo-hydrolase [Bryobacteraceae bacterium]|nr:M20/M25/M40 family metallo-hydrolase [Bryobacteraceae bacterium]